MEEKTTIKEAFTELAPRYEKVVDKELQKFWGWSYENFIESLILNTKTIPGEHILDIATGTCLIPRRLIENKRQVKITGIDITHAMLKHGKEKIIKSGMDSNIYLATGDAMLMPFKRNSFELAMCGLATHHMNVSKLLGEVYRVLKPDGRFSLADVGGSSLWRKPIASFFIKILAYIYFLITENKDRAWAEATAVENVQTTDSWFEKLTKVGFTNIEIEKLPSKSFWVPDPLLIQATKPKYFPGEE
ncbi:MAG: class I SAM-dependent methyltransferase [Anaerolineaceae bacterium]